MNLYSACSPVSALNGFVHFALHEKKNSKNFKSPGETFVPVIGLLKKKTVMIFHATLMPMQYVPFYTNKTS